MASRFTQSEHLADSQAPIPDPGAVTIASGETAGGPCLRVSRDWDARRVWERRFLSCLGDSGSRPAAACTSEHLGKPTFRKRTAGMHAEPVRSHRRVIDSRSLNRLIVTLRAGRDPDGPARGPARQVWRVALVTSGARRTGCSASGHSRCPTALPTLWICRSVRARAATGLAVAPPGDQWLRRSGQPRGPGFTSGPRGAAPRPRLRSMRRPALSDRRQGKSCSSAAGRLRSDAAGTSPSAISLAEHRVEFGVGPDRPDLLRAAAGDGDLSSPLQRLLA